MSRPGCAHGFSEPSGGPDQRALVGTLVRASFATMALLTRAGAEHAERSSAQIARSLSPMTGTLTPAEARRLTALLEQILGGMRAARSAEERSDR